MAGSDRGEFGHPGLGRLGENIYIDGSKVDGSGSWTLTKEIHYPASASEQARRVLDVIEEAVGVFMEKNQGYGNTGYVLGARGQYADMNRKMGKLKHTLWDGNKAIGESMEEMLMDLIGHAALTIDYLRMETEEG